MSADMIDLVGALKQRQRLVVRRYEMSEGTFRQLEKQLEGNLYKPKPEEQRANSLWGIPIHFDNNIPLGEIKPIYA